MTLTTSGDRHLLTLLPGADGVMVRDVLVALSAAVYLTFDVAHQFGPDGVILVFRSLPCGAPAVAERADPDVTDPLGLPSVAEAFKRATKLPRPQTHSRRRPPSRRRHTDAGSTLP